ncbi:hypothetical protein [Gynuella sunshinyii]|uniref:Uncharacterized protein n=1 Tax=Gynuella sunshinyii YC6258 TaxID=1445510 RepID=A0A0C5VF95_9GAMM|nr:hypothetical protein [Gynuella sunshinyii]AJQ97940.1 hypothetical Protein YC6258_05916 [Gynuella sunshinyii YC6258]
MKAIAQWIVTLTVMALIAMVVSLFATFLVLTEGRSIREVAWPVAQWSMTLTGLSFWLAIVLLSYGQWKIIPSHSRAAPPVLIAGLTAFPIVNLFSLPIYLSQWISTLQRGLSSHSEPVMLFADRLYRAHIWQCILIPVLAFLLFTQTLTHAIQQPMRDIFLLLLIPVIPLILWFTGSFIRNLMRLAGTLEPLDQLIRS